MYSGAIRGRWYGIDLGVAVIVALILIWAVAGNLQGTTTLAEYPDIYQCEDNAWRYVVVNGNELNKRYLTWVVTCEEQRHA